MRIQAGWRHAPSLALSLVPGVGFVLALPAVASDPRFAFVVRPLDWPWQLAVVAVAGSIATAAGVADWVYHRTADVRIGPNERRAELLALLFGGVPTFLLLAAATVADRPGPFLLPILATLIFTVFAVAWDELLFHRRRCGPLENALHRTLTVGHAVAFLAWMDFVYR
ncbi:MAG: hypothetical protein H6734_12405 [Alphaproteobacteria bacterium]|nr:hypothetical protein [Alphaproteobacteria bacterium]